MTDWDAFPVVAPATAPPATAWDAFPVVAPAIPQTSQTLGFFKGAMHPFDRAALALEGAANSVGLARPLNALGSALGMVPSAGAAEQGHEQYVADQAKAGVVPGKIGEFAGNVAATLPLVGMGPVSGGMAAGALLGDSDTPGGVAMDAALGGVGGKAGDLAVRGLAAVSKPIVRAVANKVQDWTSPLASATRDAGQYVYGLLGESAPADIKAVAESASGKPLTGAEAIGRNGTSALAALGRRSGTTADLLSAQIQERAAAAPDRILGDYATAAGIDPVAARGDMDALLQNGREAAAPLFEQALSKPGGVWSKDLAAISQRPVVQKALAQAYDDILNAGKDPAGFGFTAKDPGTGQFIKQPRPTAEAWDLVKKNVSGQVERDPFGKPIPDSISRGNYNVGVAGRDLTGAMKDAIPGYGEALDRSGDYLSLNKAFQDGQNFILKPGVTAAQMADRVADLSPAELQAFKGGIANKLFDQTQVGRLRPAIFDQPIVRQKLMVALGPEKATQFLDSMKIEAQMAKNGARMNPDTGSITSNILNTTAEQDQKGAAVMDGIYAGLHAAHGNTIGAGARILSAARRLGYGVDGKMSEQTRNEVGKLLMMSPEDLANHLQSLDGAFNPPVVNRVAGGINAMRPAAIGAGALAGSGMTASPASTLPPLTIHPASSQETRQ